MSPQQLRAHDREVDAVVEAYERFMQLISVGHAPELVEMSMSMAQMKVLYLLWARREVQMSELVGMLGVSISTVSGLVDRLVEAGLARRREDSVDRRHVVVGISDAGIELLDRFRELGQRQMRQLLDALDTEELDLVRRCIDLLTAAASRKERP